MQTLELSPVRIVLEESYVVQIVEPTPLSHFQAVDITHRVLAMKATQFSTRNPDSILPADDCDRLTAMVCSRGEVAWLATLAELESEYPTGDLSGVWRALQQFIADRSDLQ